VTDSSQYGEDVWYRRVAVQEMSDSDVAAALAAQSARLAGLGRADCARVSIVARELATNIARHAGKGVLTLCWSTTEFRLIAEDDGPGIVDVESAMADGFSRGRRLGIDDSRREGLGCGLGAVRRLMERLEITSAPGSGTRVVARKSIGKRARV
jgi:serine/threonine-protein kinase RsbT